MRVFIKYNINIDKNIREIYIKYYHIFCINK